MPRPSAGSASRARPPWFPIAALLLAMFARARGLAEQSLWFDEGWSAHAAAQPALAAALGADPTNPPLYYAVLHLFSRGVGLSELSLRFTSLFFGILTVALCGRLAARLAGGSAGRWALLAAACAPLLWWSSQEARMYSLLSALAVVAALAWHQLRARHPTRVAWAALLASEIGLLYAHNTGPIAILWLNGVTGLSWISGGRPRRPAWRPWLACQAAAVALYGPWLAGRLALVPEANRILDAGPRLSWPTAAQAWTGYWSGTWSVALHEPVMAVLRPGVPPFVGVAGLALAFAVVLAARRQAVWPVVHALLLSTGIVVGLARLGLPLNGRYFVIAAPFVATALGIGVGAIPDRPRRAAGLLLLSSLAVAMWFSQQPRHARDDARGVVQSYADGLSGDDTVVVWSYADRYDLAYYWPRAGVRARRVVVPDGATADEAAARLPRSGRVAVNVWPTQRADVRGMLPCLLGHGAAARPELQDHRDMQTLLFPMAPTETPRTRPIEAVWPFARATYGPDVPLGWTSDRLLCVRFGIILTEPLDVDLKARVEARNGLGQSVTREDVALTDDLGRHGSQLAGGESLAGFALLELPRGAPGGTYDLTLRLYDEVRQPWGYSVRGERAGPDAALGTWTVTPSSIEPSAADAGVPFSVDGPRIGDRKLVGTSLDPMSPPEVRPGDLVGLTLLWQGDGPLPDLALTGAGGAWSAALARHEGRPGPTTIDWLAGRVPAEAESGFAVLASPAGASVGRLRVTAPPKTNSVPRHGAPVGARFPSVGTLVGVTAGSASIERGRQLPVELIWRAGPATDRPYTVFVHLLDAEGRSIGQSDHAPAGGARPTTGWREGEIVVDRHVLEVAAAAASGAARLRAGIYDPETGERVLLDDGTDSVDLPVAVTVR